jgi:hypothetical protein
VEKIKDFLVGLVVVAIVVTIVVLIFKLFFAFIIIAFLAILIGAVLYFIYMVSTTIGESARYLYKARKESSHDQDC